MSFTHAPLESPRHIRLLRVEWKADKTAEGLECTLAPTSLDNAPEFTALSYAWESQKPSVSILCDGHGFLVTENCSSLLRSVAQDDALRGGLFWIDSVCIDQTSLEERNQQVALMADIYKSSSQTIIWLGDKDEDAFYVMDALSAMGLLKNLAAMARFGVILHPLQSLLGRPWFGRLWTLQEVVLSRDAVLRFGGHSIPWASLNDIDKTITTCNAALGFTQYPGDVFQRVRVVSDLRGMLGIDEGAGLEAQRLQYGLPDDHPFGPVTIKRSDFNPMLRVGIAEHFLLSCSLGSMDERDRVFGLFGILQEYGVRLPAPDYKKPLAVLYREAAQCIMDRDSTLELLYCCSVRERSAKLEDLPSWVPDFSSLEWFAWIPGWEFTTASGTSPAWFDFGDDDRLSARGVRIGSITSLTGTTDSLSKEALVAHSFQVSRREMFRAIMPTIEALRAWINFALDCEGKATDATGALCTVLLQEVAQAYSVDPAKWARLRGHFADWCASLTAAGGFPAGEAYAGADGGDGGCAVDAEAAETSERAMEQLYRRLEQDEAVRTVQHLIMGRVDGNCLFKTTKGMLGIAPKCIQEEDEVFLIAGLGLPMILRPVAGASTYRLVGPAYIAGVMRGELWPEEDREIVRLDIV
ncbi:heterokaryon incompatibility protein-domain-containing protein [Podospora conica]|nr:heterokaryon incompatibility protein-domain-containing protein [Schizothecium conicum]